MGPNETLELTLPVRSASIPRARAAAAAYARQAGLAPERIHDLKLVVSEAVTNVVLHAYDGDEGTIHLTMATAGKDLWVLVEDHGLGLRSGGTSPGLGLGLGLMARFSDEIALERTAGGGTLLRTRFARGARQAESGPGEPAVAGSAPASLEDGLDALRRTALTPSGAELSVAHSRR